MNIRGTGGGPQKPSTITSLDVKVMEMVKTQIVGLTSEFDCDAVTVGELNNY